MTELFSEALQLLVVGVATVFVALIVTGLVVWLLGHLLRDKPPVPAAAAKPLPEASLGGVDKHVLVLLAAAATVAVKHPIRIRRVRFVTHKHIPASWAATGRADHTKDILH
jgi:Na+-transporting methylmalonyl-CoA/oxaloacetate decarboxylase gamma subunit